MWNIVLVDDEIQTLEGMHHIIPWELLGASCSGMYMDACSLLRDFHNMLQPDLIVTDIYMPDMDGLEMIVRLREMGYEGKFLIMSGYSDFEYAQRALRLHVSDYLTKPTSPPTLRNAIGKVLDQLVEENNSRTQEEAMSNLMRRTEQFALQEWLRRQVIRDISGDLEQPLLPIEGRYNNEGYYMACGIEIVQDERVGSFSPIDLKLIRYGLQNMIHELLEESELLFHYVDLHSHSSVIILCLPESTIDLEQSLKSCMSDIIAKSMQYLSVQLRIGVGCIHQGYKHLHLTTEEAFRAISFELNPLNATIFRYAIAGEPSEKMTMKPFFPYTYYLQIAEMLQTSRIDEANSVVNSFIQYIKSQALNHHIVPEKIANEINIIVKHALFSIGRTNMELDDHPVRIQTLNQLETWLMGKVESICESGHEAVDNRKHRQAVEYMIQYIADHYMEDIGTSEVAAKLYMSRNHVANIFRTATGDSFTTYLVKYRMNKAKEMIKSGNYLIYEVAERVGYKNVPYFSTLFKKHTGLNPSELYKE